MMHTPTPWNTKGTYIRANGTDGQETIAQTFHVLGEPRDSSSFNAAFIVRAVNSHDALVAALKTLVESGGIGPESMFHAARKALAEAEKP